MYVLNMLTFEGCTDTDFKKKIFIQAMNSVTIPSIYLTLIPVGTALDLLCRLMLHASLRLVALKTDHVS